MIPYRRIRLTVSYDGTAYAGWQRQRNAPSVQETLERALHSLTGEQAAIVGASRTDAGVHALGQVAHFDTRSRIPPEKFCFALNTRLPDDIRVVASQQVSPAFHARYGARGKTYRYQIHNSPHASALYRLQRAHVAPPLDVERMRRAALPVLGEHDFRAFAAAGGQSRGTVRDITRLDIRREGALIDITVEGRSFLYNMVRILAGTVLQAGLGKMNPAAVPALLQSRNRGQAGPTLPARGLFLWDVQYPDLERPND